MFNRDMADFINQYLEGILSSDSLVTTTKIQNYVRWDLIPKPHGRKYTRTHLAMVIVVTFLKEILTIHDVKEGIDLSLKLMSAMDAYNMFAESMEDALEQVFNVASKPKKKYKYPGFTSPGAFFTVDAAVHALALKIFTQQVLLAGGLDNLQKEERRA